jgi:methionine aminotransferase
MIDIVSKLPDIGTTIFTVVSARAKELGAINLGQGFPEYDPPQRLKELLVEQISSGNHQYAPMTGAEVLREQIAGKYAASYHRNFDPDTEITVTLGATEGIFSAILALVHPGDEVILFDPSYDSYAPAIRLVGGRPIHIPLLPPRFAVDWEQVREMLTARTRMIIINTPHNPTGTVLRMEDLDALAEITRGTGTLVLADEVYEHLTFDGVGHASVCGHPELYERSVAVFSFGKALHATGWRVGYTIAPATLTREIRRVHQFNTFSIAHPLQNAIAAFLREQPQHNAGLKDFYQRKRDLFLDAVRDSRFTWTPSMGTFFQLLDFSAISAQNDVEFADRLIREAGVAAIPVSVFYAHPPKLSVVRFCFAKNDTTLTEAGARLCRI